jgi:cobalt/nickel transport system permease protein
MHIPDGFLNTVTAATTYVVSASGVGYSIRQANRKLGDRHVPLMGVMGAFIFAAQILNFPVIGGTSGHLIGAALAAILLGPWAGTLIMACVLIIQCLVFQDGGLTALGANVFNMGLVACFVGYYLYRVVVALMGESRASTLVGGFAGAWASVFVASIFCAIELAVSGRSPLGVALPAMAGVHALIGIGEGLITAAVLAFVAATRADLLELQKV